MSNKQQRRKAVVSSYVEAPKSASNSLDWDSPSTKTGTVKRRPNSSDSYAEFEIHEYQQNEKTNTHHQTKDEHFPRGKLFREKTECPENAFRENYLGDFVFSGMPRKSGSPKKADRSVSVYEPPPLIKGFNGDRGRMDGVDSGSSLSANFMNSINHLAIPDNWESTARRIKVLSLDASQERIRSIHNFVQNKYVIYKKDRTEAARRSIPVYRPGKGALWWESKESHTSSPTIPTQIRKEYHAAKESSHSSKLNCHLSYPCDVLSDSMPLRDGRKCGKYGKRLTINEDLAREKEYSIETNGPPSRRTQGSFEVGGNVRNVDSDRGVGRRDSSNFQQATLESTFTSEYHTSDNPTSDAAEHNSTKTGKVSDTDSGIASPLSPGSVYGFLGYTDKDNGKSKNRSLEKYDKVGRSRQDCCCEEERLQVSGEKGFFMVKI
ncbi:hypothetical protein JTB14_007085 [Gonioctena quinquepunctata]|nr:hypothetical protein JTB14_007085 [Gonioctena quinquepunctata]